MENRISSKFTRKLLTGFAVLFLSLLSVNGMAQVKWNSAYQNYIDIYKDLAIEQMLKHNIPASITLAQGLLESGAGKSTLATMGNNHFGIKCHGWSGQSMRKNDDAPDECFRVYGNPRESFEDHSAFLKRDRYQRLFTYRLTDYKSWAKGLKECGYATSPTYAQTLISIIETYKLYEYDKAKTYDRFIVNHSVASKDAKLEGQVPHRLFAYNKNYYVVARRGDTFESLSKELEISAKKLAKYNERSRYDVLNEGDIVYLLKKQKKAAREYKKRKHIVKAGESLYSISQFYGIRLKSLYKKNGLSLDYSPRVGDGLIVY